MELRKVNCIECCDFVFDNLKGIPQKLSFKNSVKCIMKRHSQCKYMFVMCMWLDSEIIIKKDKIIFTGVISFFSFLFSSNF